MGKTKIERAIKSIQTIIDCELKIKKELRIIDNYFVFKGFQEYGNNPSVNICSGYELAIVFNGYELDILSAFALQENKGYIEPSDIPGLYCTL